MSSWYADGLRFACTRCGNCCTGSPGYVWLSPRDEEAIHGHLGLTRREFRSRYTRLVGHLLSLVERADGECVFLTEERSCEIQPVKPRQCLTFPFWPRIVATRESWSETTAEGRPRGCPGMNEGPLFRPEEVDAITDRESPRELICRIFQRKRE